jgi:homoserine O-acetyltransferase
LKLRVETECKENGSKAYEMDPEWKKGEYTAQPKVGLSGAIGQLMFMVSSPLQWQNQHQKKQRKC